MIKIDEKIIWLLDVNKKNSDKFIKDELPRRLYEAEHKTIVIALKCMDGRINIPLATGTPLGIIKPYRNIGGYFNMGWPMLGADIQDVIEEGVSNGRRSLILITYHYSIGDPHRGCAGFNYDNNAVFDFTLKLHNQFSRIFGENNGVVFPVVVGLETDTDSLVFHPQNPSDKNAFYITAETKTDEDYLMSMINGLYPNMDGTVKKDLLPLIEGNIAHIKEVKESGREPNDMQHKEWVLGIGRGFDWLHEPNTALLVGPFNPELSNPIIKALGIISDNMKSGRTNDDGFLVLSSAIFEKNGNDKNRAIEKTNFFSSEAEKIIKNNFPELLPKARFMRVVVDENTRRIEQVSKIDM